MKKGKASIIQNLAEGIIEKIEQQACSVSLHILLWRRNESDRSEMASSDKIQKKKMNNSKIKGIIHLYCSNMAKFGMNPKLLKRRETSNLIHLFLC